ncbi:hypothetical protein TUSST3_85620 [Streptomyces sp. TUS-ST3]|nr:hypothetical protein TUSST3_85620 [Streptomyces sp. TUS-ST3]
MHPAPAGTPWGSLSCGAKYHKEAYGKGIGHIGYGGRGEVTLHSGRRGGACGYHCHGHASAESHGVNGARCRR